MGSHAVWIVGGALLTYGLFHCWYVGFGKRVAPELRERLKLAMEKTDIPEFQRSNILQFLERDDGKDFVMVNLLELKQPRAESRKKLTAYSKIFLGSLLRRAGHPVAMATAASGKIESVNVAPERDWGVAFLVRYRSRTDFAEVMLETLGSEHHGLKLDALARTIAFPAAPWSLASGPRILVPLLIALLATIALYINAL
ncbi:hypothetical protein KUV95_09055 [Microbulbifer agarilyticus]|uniref:hypothetical protein n=1 Tax=Microbulbifer agarilyticus TaxID=260552 RepID=UPI001C95A682|nr:hypothetical protein [Microbulbifer agarilyticus]MBY6211704.1 hypothetical protein [Microbulbifer agarilyticus]